MVPSPTAATATARNEARQWTVIEGGRRSQGAKRGETLELIQIFRGLAALLVLLYHVTHTNHFHLGYASNAFGWGHCGVDFFFVLSGFVMLYAHFEQAGRPRLAWRFLLKRAIRIYPIYWCVLAVTVFMFWTYPPTLHNMWATPSTLQPSTLRSAIFLADPRRPVVSVAWTLSYELLFYAFFTLYILCGARSFTVLSLAWCSLLVAQSTGVIHWPYPILLRPVILEFFVGCIAAVLVKRLDWKRVPGWSVVAVMAGCVGVGLAELHGLIDGYKWYALPFFLLIWIGAAYDRSTPRRYPRLLVLIGEASYAIYLIHYGMIAIFAETIDRWRPWASLAPNATLTALAVVIVAAGIAVHSWIELPLLAAARRRLR